MAPVGLALVLVGALFFAAGTLGLLRFPGPLNRLHALTKADNLGLGLVAAGLAVEAASPAVAAKLALVWVVTLANSALACHLIGDAAIARQEAQEAAQGEDAEGAALRDGG